MRAVFSCRRCQQPDREACHYPHLFSFAPEALERLAGGATAGNRTHVNRTPAGMLDGVCLAPRSRAPARAQNHDDRFPVIASFGIYTCLTKESQGMARQLG